MTAKAKNILKYSILTVLAGALVWLAFGKVDWTAFLTDLKLTRWGWMLVFALAAVAAVYLRMLRWRGMLQPVCPGVPSIRVWDAANVGNLVNVVLPGAGELIRCGHVSNGKSSYEKVFGTILMERLWDLFAVAVLLMLAVFCEWSRLGSFFIGNIWQPLSTRFSFSLVWIVLALVLLVAAGVWAVFRFSSRNPFCAKVADTWRGFAQGLVSFTRMDNKWTFGAYTLGIWLMYVFMSWCAIQAVPALSSLTMFDALFISAVGNIASVIPVPGGIGAYHYLIALVISSIYGADWDTGLLFATLNHESHSILIMILGVISYISIPVRKNSSV